MSWVVGGLLCCTGDILFDLKSQGNEKTRNIEKISIVIGVKCLNGDLDYL